MLVIIVIKLCSAWCNSPGLLECLAYEIIDTTPWRNFQILIFAIRNCLIDDIPVEWVVTNSSDRLVDVVQHKLLKLILVSLIDDKLRVVSSWCCPNQIVGSHLLTAIFSILNDEIAFGVIKFIKGLGDGVHLACVFSGDQVILLRSSISIILILIEMLIVNGCANPDSCPFGGIPQGLRRYA